MFCGACGTPTGQDPARSSAGGSTAPGPRPNTGLSLPDGPRQPNPAAEREKAVKPSELCRFGEIMIADNGFVYTPAGAARVVDCEFSSQESAHISSAPKWSGGMIFIAVIVAIFTCGLGLILLFLSRRERVSTVSAETVTVDAPLLSYTTRSFSPTYAPGGAMEFVAWAKTWKAQLLAAD